MSSKLLSVSEKTRRQFLQQKNPFPRSEPRWIVTCCFSPFRAGKYGIVAGMYQSKSIFGGVYYLTVLVYTKTTIHLRVGG